ncbi:MarR family transcriptional regulator [Sphingomonas naphthae]|uniref:MarR family transcriptional regulator n=1 Tax=Sphingomonas naphthae TaxID=1813468 RepID=A0ABY7TH47_9SPHN|nr:MarR family transcriptional regulator [Sphingomonas naphthae]WCT72469.1 MarR family transcriptional regulator [Sphingomonas naphthae]
MAARTLTLDTFLPYRLSFTSNLVSDRVASIYADLFDLKIPEWRIIAVTAEREMISQQEIGQLTRMDKVTVSRSAIALTQRGLLSRLPHRDDRRSHLLTLSAEGRALYDQVAPKALEIEARLFAGFSEAELATFVSMLRRIDAIAGGGSTSAAAD